MPTVVWIPSAPRIGRPRRPRNQYTGLDQTPHLGYPPIMHLAKLIFRGRDPVDRDDVVWCYRTFLGLEPPSSTVKRVSC